MNIKLGVKGVIDGVFIKVGVWRASGSRIVSLISILGSLTLELRAGSSCGSSLTNLGEPSCRLFC